MGMNVLVIVMNRLGMATHENVKTISISDDQEHYVLEKYDGTKNYLRIDKYMLTILR